MTKIIKRIDFDPEFVPLQLPLVIKAEMIEGMGKAAKLLDRARKEASRIRKEARASLAEAHQEREEEKKKGYEDGLEEGRSLLTEKMIEAGMAQEKVLKESEPGIVRMVMEIAEKVLGRELAKGAIVDIVRKAISETVGNKIQVLVNSADVQTLRERDPELTALLTQSQSISVREDETIPPGGCVVETEMGTVDARLETQLSGIRKALGLEN